MTNRSISPSLALAMTGAGLPIAEQDAILSTSLLSASRLEGMVDAIGLVKGIPGDTAEIGAANGGTSRLIALLGKRRHWCCDTFEGLVDVCEHDAHLTNGQFHNPIDKVRDALDGVRNVEFVAGYFPDSAPQAMQEATYSLVHIDVDTYRSVHNCFRFFLGRMSVGGIIVLDDVIGRGTAGAKRAWSEITASGPNGWRVVSTNDPQVAIIMGDL